MTNGFKVIALITLLFLTSAVKAQMVETVTVDFSVDNGPVTYRASGFLHGMNRATPSAVLVNSLKGKLFRGADHDSMMDSANYARVVGQGAVNMYILGDLWIDSTGLRIVDAAHIAAWNTLVANTIHTAISNGQTFQWDIWNEPDTSVFWTGTEAQYQTMWQNAVNTIRGIDPSQIIVGPSTCCSGWGSWATNLMAFAKTNNVLPNIVTFHENSSTSQLISDVAAAKSYLAANDPSITLVDVPEMVDEGSTYLPGANVQYLAAAERSGVNAAAHSCWYGDCFDNSLDGLIGTNGRTVRAVWYAYQAYANITGRLVDVTASASVDGVAGQDSALQRAYSVFGRHASGSAQSVQVTFSHISSVSYLNPGGLVHVLAYTLANDGGGGSSGPVQIIDADYSVSNDQIVVVIPSFGIDDVSTIQLTMGNTSGGTSGRPSPPIITGAIVH